MDRGCRRAAGWLVAAVVAGLVWAPGQASAADNVYWETGNSLSFAALDTSTSGSVSTAGTMFNSPFGAALDPAAGRIYWANDGSNKISFANLNGTGGGDLNTTGATPINVPYGVAVDPAAGRIYWANDFANKISFAKLDGTGGGGDLSTGAATVSGPEGVALDPAAGRIYWANDSGGKISFANLNGSGGHDVKTTGANVDAPAGVAVDPAAGRVYWANYLGSKISYANLDDSGGHDLPTTGAIVNGPIGVAVDPVAGRIYWANNNVSKISFANLDGSGAGGEVAPLSAPVMFPRFPVMLKAPASTGPPVVDGGSSPGSTLSCSTGTWAADLSPAFLFRAARDFSYQWTLNGADIPGATASALPAGATGDYRCRVTASNQAGSTARLSDPHTIATPAGSSTSASASTASGTGVPGLPAALAPSNRFTVGRLRGTLLTVTLDSAGTLRLGDAATAARATDAKRKPKRRAKALLKPSSATGGPGDVTIELALARTATKTLKHRHKVTVNARLTFTPTGGTPSTTTTKLTVKGRVRTRASRPRATTRLAHE